MRQDIIDLYDAFTHGRMGRRAFMERLAALTGSAAAAFAAVKLLQPDPAAAAMIPEDDPRLVIDNAEIEGGPKAYWAKPAGGGNSLPGVVVIHENRGLNAYVQDVARRAAVEGFSTLAPDLLTALGGTPSDPDKARDMIGQLNPAQAVEEARATISWLRSRPDSNGKVGIVGFCWGGGMVGLVAEAEPTLDAAVVFYGPTPPLDQVPNIRAPLLLHYAGLDQRIDAGVPDFRKALEAAGVKYELHMYEGVNHAFHNDTSAERYNADAAKLAWQRTIDFFKSNLV
ncbi:MAG TPA: dienelactone hydrolase family protein [Hypericibacter adhaerens]|jgi:carboxymethylenebutenolidase|uniref:Carboxymethylenebutenolidase n=1 Tax=Hypericibacter adhaerens TaxID=2602016 RepID=A0A5J6MYJ8_9PROT|nr:dienelactone hydrolase family protein [Hypericibacter adhaerens]QEX22852.1 carboxymethylenebutenolidase [Hypericibacter adhaerens]HWA42061.1 dienelactone hydrolase family protein [Hypericibacter adhaerens]